MNIELCYLLITTLTIVLAFIASIGIFKYFKRVYCIKHFENYIVVLEYHLNKAYELIHKDQILTYSLEGSRIDEKNIDKASQDFTRLLLKMIGPLLHKEFINLYGNDNTFIFNVIEYFNSRYEEDEIRKQSIDDIASQDGES